jgi:hypothetical protein
VRGVTIQAGTPAAGDRRLCEWLEGYGVEPNLTFRVDVYDNGQMWVHQYAVNEQGQKFIVRTPEEEAAAWHPVIGEAALRGPFEVAVKEIPVIRPVPDLIGFAAIDGLRLVP